MQGEVEVLHTARVRLDWNGVVKLDLSVRQGESVEIIRVKNNPGGRWLARSLSGNCEFQPQFQSLIVGKSYNLNISSLTLLQL